MSFIFVVLLLLCLYYILFALWTLFSLSWHFKMQSDNYPAVSVIICARNEESVLEGVLTSLVGQNTEGIPFEVIVVDDRSLDRTGEIINRFQRRYSFVRSIRIEHVPVDISPKKNALISGIRESKYPIIAVTDADCRPQKTWIHEMTALMGKNTGMVVGFSPYMARHGFLNSFIRFEYMANVALSAGTISLGFGTHCTSRNLFFRKTAFEEVGGYGEHLNSLSGDDTLLLQRIQRLSKWKVRFCAKYSSLVFTDAPHSFRHFIRQRIRHFSTGLSFHPVQLLLCAGMYFFNLFLFLGLIGWALTDLPLSFVPVLLAVKIIADLVISIRMISIFKDWSLIMFFSVFFPSSLIYYSVFPFLGSFIKIHWKEHSGK